MSISSRSPSPIRTSTSSTTRRRERSKNILGRFKSCRHSRARLSRTPTASSSACCSRCCTTLRATGSRDSCRASSAGSPPISPRKSVGPRKFRRTQGRETFTAPPSNCISPIGEKAILHGLYKQIKGDFYTAVTRPPAVYRGNPFVIEAGLAFGKGPEQAVEKAAEPRAPLAEGEQQDNDDELARVIRYANRVPLLYQQSACATFKAVLDTTWRNYGVSQSRGALPAGPMVIFVHMASVWVPFTSESKEAIADYDEIRKEIRLALQECGRRLGVFLRRRELAKSEFRRR